MGRSVHICHPGAGQPLEPECYLVRGDNSSSVKLGDPQARAVVVAVVTDTRRFPNGRRCDDESNILKMLWNESNVMLQERRQCDVTEGNL